MSSYFIGLTIAQFVDILLLLLLLLLQICCCYFNFYQPALNTIGNSVHTTHVIKNILTAK